MAIRVLLTGSSSVVRAGLCHELGGIPSLEIVGEAGTTDQVMALTRRLCPDIVILDVTLPGQTAAEVVAAIGESSPRSRVVGFCMTDDASSVAAVLASGAKGWLFADEGSGALRRAVQAVASGGAWVSERTARLLSAVGPGMSVLLDVHLTRREVEVLELVVLGQSDRRIAAELGITRRTVRYHLRSIFDKLAVGSRVEAAVRAERLRILG